MDVWTHLCCGSLWDWCLNQKPLSFVASTFFLPELDCTFSGWNLFANSLDADLHNPTIDFPNVAVCTSGKLFKWLVQVLTHMFQIWVETVIKRFWQTIIIQNKKNFKTFFSGIMWDTYPLNYALSKQQHVQATFCIANIWMHILPWEQGSGISVVGHWAGWANLWSVRFWRPW